MWASSWLRGMVAVGQIGGRSAASSARSVDTIRRGPTASAACVERAWGSHFTQSHAASGPLGGEHRDREVRRASGTSPPSRSSTAPARAPPPRRRRSRSGRGPQVHGGRQVGLDPVHGEQPVQRGGGHRVGLLRRRGRRGHERRSDSGRLHTPYRTWRKSASVAARSHTRDRSSASDGSARRVGVPPEQGGTLLRGRLADDVADGAEVAEVRRARARRPSASRRVRCRSSWATTKATRGDEEHPGRQEAALLTAARSAPLIVAITATEPRLPSIGTALVRTSPAALGVRRARGGACSTISPLGAARAPGTTAATRTWWSPSLPERSCRLTTRRC